MSVSHPALECSERREDLGRAEAGASSLKEAREAARARGWWLMT